MSGTNDDRVQKCISVPTWYLYTYTYLSMHIFDYVQDADAGSSRLLISNIIIYTTRQHEFYVYTVAITYFNNYIDLVLIVDNIQDRFVSGWRALYRIACRRLVMCRHDIGTRMYSTTRCGLMHWNIIVVWGFRPSKIPLSKSCYLLWYIKRHKRRQAAKLWPQPSTDVWLFASRFGHDAYTPPTNESENKKLTHKTHI